MSTLVEQLKNAAEMEKKAYTEYVTSYSTSGITSLAKGGLSFEKAASIVKEAIQKDSKANGFATNSAIFEKAAEHISDLETKLHSLEKVAKEQEISQSTPLSKLANIGFTKEELTYMSSLPENIVEKVASIGSQPWEMGGGAGMKREKTDALLEFILS